MDLLRTMSFHAEKQFRKRSGFPTVLWLTEDVTGARELWQTWCDTPASVSGDAEVLAELAEGMGAEFRKRGLRAFAVAYLAVRTRVLKTVTTGASSTLKHRGVMLEAHTVDQHWSAFREIVDTPQRRFAAMEPPQPAPASGYTGLLQRQEADATADHVAERHRRADSMLWVHSMIHPSAGINLSATVERLKRAQNGAKNDGERLASC